MPPKKKDKSRGSDWLQCTLCGHILSHSDAETHAGSCLDTVTYIDNKVLHGKIFNAESLLSDDGSKMSKSVRDPVNALWLSVSAMQVCGLSIGQPCLVNGVKVMMSWPAKLPELTGAALTFESQELLGLQNGSEVTVQRFHPTNVVTESLTLDLRNQNAAFETGDFCNFVASYLDGKYVAVGTPLEIRYFGQVCRCSVAKVTPDAPVTSDNTNSSCLFVSTDCQDQTPDKFIDKSITEDKLSESGHSSSQCNSSSLDCTADLSGLLNSLNISEESKDFQASTPKVMPKPRYSNLRSPNMNITDLGTYVDSYKFSQISSRLTKVSMLSSKNAEGTSTNRSNIGPSLDEVGGLSVQITELKSRLQRAQQPKSSSRCILLYGPSGTGKTLLTKAFISQLGIHCSYVAGTDIWSKLFGEAESNLKNIFTNASERGPSIIVMDDIDVMCPRRSQNQGGQQERIVGTLLSLIDGITGLEDPSKPVVVLGVTNNRDGLDPALRRAGRFGCEVEIPVPSVSERQDILQVLLKKFPNSISKEDLSTVAGNAHGYTGADLAALVNEAHMHAFRQESSDSVCISTDVAMDNLVYAGLHVKPSALREVQLEVPKVRWSDIGGMTEVKMRLREAVELPLSRPEVFKELGIEPPRGLLMYGPPGCSKTMVARALATECNLNFLAVKGPELFNQYVGESEKSLREVFRKARSAAPSVIFFDEIDAIAATRGSSGSSSGVEDRVLTQLLTEMDGLEHLKDVFIMAATNRPDKMDKALLRPGRFDSLVYVPLPDDQTRKEILDKKLSKMCVDDDVKVDWLVEETIDYSGAEIIQICQEAALYALRLNIDTRSVEAKHFDYALSKVKPQIDPKLLQIYLTFSHSRPK